MVPVSLENLETLSKKGIDREVIRNTSSIVYVGKLCRTITRSPGDSLPQEWRTPYVSWSLSKGSHPHRFQTNATLGSFFLAMARNTDIMRTAQRQLDSVLGDGRLPDHSDIDNLPYIVAIVKETFRWAPPLPIGTTHRLMEDDVYRGMFIPGGATVVENIWCGRLLMTLLRGGLM